MWMVGREREKTTEYYTTTLEENIAINNDVLSP